MITFMIGITAIKRYERALLQMGANKDEVGLFISCIVLFFLWEMLVVANVKEDHAHSSW